MSTYHTAFAPVASTSKMPASSTSTSSAPASSFPYPLARRDSTSSSTYSSTSSSESDTDDYSPSSDEDDDDALLTPDASPEILPIGHASAKGKQRATFDLSASFGAFSLADIEEDVVPVEWTRPSAPPSPTSALPSVASVKPLTPSAAFSQPPAPSAFPSPSPRPAPESPPSAVVEDDAAPRGRSRWPRLLWRSELDLDSLTVLKDYHERAVGGPLPVLKRGMGKREVERWSYAMEGAGL